MVVERHASILGVSVCQRFHRLLRFIRGSGLYHLAQKRPDVELIPVLMDNLNRILPKGEVLPVPLIGHVTFGAPLKLLPDENKLALLERARAEVMRLHHV